jgi:hypothetical protein
MNDFDRPGVTVDEPLKGRSASSRFGDLGDRLVRTFGSADRAKADPSDGGYDVDPEYPVVDQTTQSWEEVLPRFPTVRHGYHCAAVDEHIAELEHELAELRARTPSASAIATAIERIGEQTAAILVVAHQQAQETTRRAQAQADSCLANAASNAVAITEEANQQLRQLDRDTDSIWRERGRLIEDARSVASALFSLAEDAAERFDAEPERVDLPVPAAPRFDAEPERVDPPAPAAPEPTGDAATNGQAD